MNRSDIMGWLRENDSSRLQLLWAAADAVRRAHVGQMVHLRGLVELSNFCRRDCAYCGIRRGNRTLARYRLSAEAILECASAAERLGCRTLVLQAGEDAGMSCDFIERIIRMIRDRSELVVTLSLGEREVDELARLRRAGADRYLLRFETSNRDLLSEIHPAIRQDAPTRVDLLRILRELGYEVGSGVMVGLPGTSYEDLATDIEWFRDLDLDMVGVGPFVPHPSTPLAYTARPLPRGQQVARTSLMTLKVMALARLVCPDANIPVTTALATVCRHEDLKLGFSCGANVWMPNVTPARARAQFDIYPGKASRFGGQEHGIHDVLRGLGRPVATHRGDRPRYGQQRGRRPSPAN